MSVEFLSEAAKAARNYDAQGYAQSELPQGEEVGDIKFYRCSLKAGCKVSPALDGEKFVVLIFNGKKGILPPMKRCSISQKPAFLLRILTALRIRYMRWKIWNISWVSLGLTNGTKSFMPNGACISRFSACTATVCSMIRTAKVLIPVPGALFSLSRSAMCPSVWCGRSAKVPMKKGISFFISGTTAWAILILILRWIMLLWRKSPATGASFLLEKITNCWRNPAKKCSMYGLSISPKRIFRNTICTRFITEASLN